jgi:hypothetical protein
MYEVDPEFIKGSVLDPKTGKELFAFSRETFSTLMTRIEREIPGKSILFKKIPFSPK